MKSLEFQHELANSMSEHDKFVRARNFCIMYKNTNIWYRNEFILNFMLYRFYELILYTSKQHIADEAQAMIDVVIEKGSEYESSRIA